MGFVKRYKKGQRATVYRIQYMLGMKKDQIKRENDGESELRSETQ